MAALAALVLALPAGAQVIKNGGLPTPNPLFPDDNWWNRDVRCAPVDPNSAAYLNHIGTGIGLHPDFGGDDPDNAPNGIFGMVYITVSGSQPRETVTFVEFGSQSDTCPPGMPAFCGYPIPVEARTQAKWIEGGQPGGGNSGDRHMLIVDRDNHILYELYHAHWNAGLSHWEAGSGAIFLLDRNGRRPDTWTSADASGMAILPGLVRYDEVTGPDPDIHHAFRFTTDDTNGYVYPASHEAGNTAGALPMGARLRLKAGVNISGYPAYIQKVFRAMKTYGLIVADNGSSGYVQGTWNTLWDNGELNPAFDDLTFADFEVIKLGWDAAKGDFGSTCDGQLDLVLDNLSSNANQVWLMNPANGVVQSSTAAVTPDLASADWKIVGTDDFNLDSHADLVTWNQVTGAVEFWLMNGPARSGSAVALTGAAPLPVVWRLAATADFNHDGWPDLFWRNETTQKLLVWIMAGTAKVGEIVPSPDQAVNSNWSVVAALDLNGDLDTDLLWYNSTSGKIVRWLMNASVVRILGEFADPPNAGNNNWKVVAAGDVGVGPGGLPGTKDLIWRNDTSGKLVAWYLDFAAHRTSSTFTTPDAPPSPLNWNVVGPK